MLDRAKSFLNRYKSDNTMLNFGANYYLLRELFENEAITIEGEKSLREFVDENKDLLKAVDLRDYMNTTDNSFDFHEYLSAIDTEFKIMLDDVNAETLDKSSRMDELRWRYEDTSATYAFLYETNLLTGQEDYKLKLNTLRHETDTKEFVSKLYGVDKSAYWPITQIKELPIYAAVGFSEHRIKEHFKNTYFAAGYFYEILKHDIQYVVALGNAGDESIKMTDFPPFFLEEKEYVYKDQNDQVVMKVHVAPGQISAEPNFSYTEHKLKCTYEFFDPITKEMTSNAIKEFTVINIPMQDGTPIRLNELSSQELFPKLLDSLRKNGPVLVHCKAGMGRTGAFIAELVTHFLDGLNYIFSDDNPKNINQRIYDFVMDLRRYRTGLILEPEQLFQFLTNVVSYASYSNSLAQEKEVTESITSNKSNIPKKRKLEVESDTQTSTGALAIEQGIFRISDTTKKAKQQKEQPEERPNQDEIKKIFKHES